MELCSFTATPTFLKFKASLFYPSPSLISLPRSTLLVQPIKRFFFTSPKQLPTLPSRQFKKISSPFVASASTAAVDIIDGKLPADLKVTVTHEPNSRVRLSVEVPPIVCEDCYRRVIREFMNQAKVPGFRPGKNVPESILLGFIGKQNVQKATVESILKRTLPHAMSSVTGKALEDSICIATKFSDMEKTYTSLKLRDNILSRGLVLFGDVAVLDISATTIEEDELAAKRIPSAESKGFQFDTEDGDRVLPGFLDSIVGIQRDETKSFPFVFPESWKQEDLRGVHARFTVECEELFCRDLPDLNDSIAYKLLPGCTTLKEVKEALLQKCLEVEQTAKEQAADNAILDQICKMIEVDIPWSLFEEQGRQLYAAQLLQIQANTKLSEQQLAYFSSPKAVKEFLENNKENITQVIKQNLAVADIFKRENLQFSTEELVKEVKNSMAEFEKHKQEYDEERVKEQVQEVLEGAKVLEWLREHAEIQYTTR